MSKTITLANNRGLAIVDDEDFALVSRYKWRLRRTVRTDGSYKDYASRAVWVNGKTSHQYMHQLLLGGSSQEFPIDHIDDNGLNNTRDNIRTLSLAQNLRRSNRVNSLTGYRGVVLRSWGKYAANICLNGRSVHLGMYATALEASEAYEAARQKALAT